MATESARPAIELPAVASPARVVDEVRDVSFVATSPNVGIVVVEKQDAPVGCCMSCRTCGWRIRFCMRRVCQPDFSWRNLIVSNFTYFRIHFMYFIFLSVVGGAAIYGIERSAGQTVPYMDTLFVAVSACCVTGLSTINVSQLHTGSHIVLMILMFLGSNVLMSVVPVIIRLRYFYLKVASRFDDERLRLQTLENQAEYKALRWVVFIAVAYVLCLQIIAIIIYGCYLSYAAQNPVLQSYNTWWVGAFLSTSSFNNAGFTLTPDNLVSFNSDYVVLLVSSCLILAGNIAYPIVFRCIVFLCHRARTNDASLKFLLDKPRRCYTHMFPSLNTKVLLLAIVSFTLLQFILFMSLDFNSEVLAPFPGHIRALIAYYQSVSTRTAGFNVVDLSQLSPALQVVIALMMYVAAYPFLLTVRKSSEASTKVKERAERRNSDGLTMSYDATVSRNLRTPIKQGFFSSPNKPTSELRFRMPDSARKMNMLRSESYFERELEGPQQAVSGPAPSSVKEQAKSVASKDLLWLFLALLVICIAENERLKSDPYPHNFSVFGVLFELSSAYGTVGLSLGYPGKVTSLSGEFSTLAKIVICLVMLFGRHRGLPQSIDSAVYLPDILNTNAPEQEPAEPLSQMTMAAVTIGARALQHPSRSFASLRSIFAPNAGNGPNVELVVDRTMFEDGAEVVIVADVAQSPRRFERKSPTASSISSPFSGKKVTRLPSFQGIAENDSEMDVPEVEEPSGSDSVAGSSVHTLTDEKP